MPLYLASHVHVCESNGQVVCLDVRRDDYIGLAPAQAQLLAAMVVDWPLASGEALKPLSVAHHPFLQKWQDLGMLTSSPPSPPRSRCYVPPAEGSLANDVPGTWPRADHRIVIHLLIAAIRAASLRHRSSFESLLLHQQARRSAAELRRKSNPALDIGDELASFFYLRSICYRVRRHCLFDSLVLLEYLAPQGRFPLWVFGVRAKPFHAHCWLQEGSLVYNDVPERVRQYTPILAV